MRPVGSRHLGLKVDIISSSSIDFETTEKVAKMMLEKFPMGIFGYILGWFKC